MSHARRRIKQLSHRPTPSARTTLIAPPKKELKSGRLSALMAPLAATESRLNPKATVASYQSVQALSRGFLPSAKRDAKPSLWGAFGPLINWLQGDGVHQNVALLATGAFSFGHWSKPQAAIRGMVPLRTEPMMGRPQHANRLHSPLKSPPCKRCPALAGGLCLCAQKQRTG